MILGVAIVHGAMAGMTGMSVGMVCGRNVSLSALTAPLLLAGGGRQRETDRHTDRQRETDRQTDRQRQRQREAETPL